MSSPGFGSGAPATSARAHAHRIALVVEDDPGARRLLMRVLQQLSFAPIGFSSAEAALAWVELNDPPALISVDMRLPGISGMRLIQIVRARPATSQTPIVVLTARDNPQEEAEALLLSCGYLAKPFRLQEYIGVIERLVAVERAPTLDRLAVTPSSDRQSVHFWARDRH